MSIHIKDSTMNIESAVKQNPEKICPNEILAELVLIDVKYYSFDNKIHIGQAVVHMDLASDIRGGFELLYRDKFPIQSVIPISDKKFAWDDSISTLANNSSAFNYRNVRDTSILSYHAFGRAIDINPRLNPYFPGKKVFPPQATYKPDIPGTIVANSRLVEYFEKLGWQWGGRWHEERDYQHFEKP